MFLAILKRLEPIDRAAVSLILLLSLAIGFLLLGGDRSLPKVRDFSWQNKQVGARDTAFVLTFSRPMDRASVEANLHIYPPLPGKISWSGRRLVYTLIAPPQYDRTYKIELQKAREKLGFDKQGKAIAPFVSQFSTPDRAFVYKGTEAAEKGRLILYNLTRKQKIILTPENLAVKDFRIYPAGDRILFSASEWSKYQPGLYEQSLYAATTGRSSNPAQKPGNIQQILGNQDYENLKFDLSGDGKAIAVQRAKRGNAEDIGLWVLRPETSPIPQRLLSRPAGEFAIAPDSATLANPQADGIAILSLTPNVKPLEFIPSFRRVFSFTPDGRKSAMLKYNSDFSQSIFLVTNQGLQTELSRTAGEFITCQFDPRNPQLYCLLTRRNPGQDFSEKLTLEAIDLQTLAVKPLLVLPDQVETKMSLSPDGLELLLDRVVAKKSAPVTGDLRTEGGSAIASSTLILLNLKNAPASQNPLLPEELPLKGFRPRWLP
ncbi:Ig-like domain-containing protein [Microcoleus sp. herbarium7]|uniref:Ig-like domain-containing protein n=1 Tax=Microcoleus sp. herbarium7 TaxID=3055435 RepID=UPI002FD05949